jgi:hypothetical protein
MAKLPYIKFYPGDWERDANCLTDNAEYGLFKLTLKLSDADTKGVLNTSFKTLAVMFKSNVKSAKEVIKELIDNKILNITIISDSNIQIVSRRLTKEAVISETRKETGSKGGLAKAKQNDSKTLPNDLENYVRDEKLEKSIMDYFEFTEIANIDKQSLILQFCKCLFLNNKLEYFSDQFPAYVKYKNANGFKHSFKLFIGSQAEFYLDGAWNAENWIAKLKVGSNQPNNSAVYIAPKKPVNHQNLPQNGR